MGGVEHTYTLDGTRILRETYGTNVLVTLHNNEDGLCGIVYNGEPYYFVKNLQGDIIALVDEDCNTVVRYKYDAWGKCTITCDNSGVGIATVNPYRYRGYYYDTETGLYYLQSRYYDPETGRFINADEAVIGIIPHNVISHNIFAYCNNNVCNLKDALGYIAIFDDAAFALAILYFIGICAILMGLCALMSTSEFQEAWTSLCEAIGNGLEDIGQSIADGGQAAWNWTKGKVADATAAVALAIEIVKAESRIRHIVKENSRERYWAATVYKYNGKPIYVVIGRSITYGQAVKRVSEGNSVFTVTSAEAYAVASAAYGNKTPFEKDIHGDTIGYFWHYHVFEHMNDAHVFYLF